MSRPVTLHSTTMRRCRHFAADLRRAFGDVNFCELAERNQRAARRWNENVT